MKRLLSVIIPCYNAERYLKECLDSLVHQTVGIQRLEIILVDDASTDKSLSIMKQYEEEYPDNILIIPLEKNAGQANARNMGMHYVSAEYFTFLDADDWMECTEYEKMLNLAHTSKCDLIQCGTVEIIEGLEPNYNSLKNPSEAYYIHTVEERKEFLSMYRLTRMIGNSLYRTDWIRDDNLEFKSYPKYEDNYWSGLIIYSFQSYCSTPECLSGYRIIENSSSHSRNDERHFARLEVELEKMNYYLQKGLFQTFYKEIRNHFLKNFYDSTLHIIFCQFDDIPMDRILMMQHTVKEIYPDYLDYCRESAQFINPVLTVAFQFPIDVWKKYKNAYLNWLEKGQENGIVEFYMGLRSALGIE